MSDTIAAVATGNVRSAIGILRLSGDGAVAVAERMFRAKRPLSEAEPRKLVYGELLGEGGAVLDRCLCTVSRAPRSFTGEDTAEFQCHGSPVVLAAALRTALAFGARQAEPGEFTKRAFLNGKLDLTAAEAVIDLIDAETEEAAKNASGQLAGAVSRKTDAVYDALLDLVSHFQAEIDFPDDEIDPFVLADCRKTLREARQTLSALLDTFGRGRVLREGVATAIVGRPNVGKSSLLNALLGYERAIVTDVPGTTRDTVEEKCVLGGVLLRLCDTAGLRETCDAVERLGVERAREAVRRADLLLVTADASEGLIQEDRELLLWARESGKPWLLLMNKSDLAVCEEEGAIPVSAKTGAGLDTLAARINALFAGTPVPPGELITNERQAGELRRALEALTAAEKAAAEGVAPDAALTEVEEALTALGALTGRNLREDVTARIFERFCVGK